jgi:pimeloyl-ACP methyl ester carboxylesterase
MAPTAPRLAPGRRTVVVAGWVVALAAWTLALCAGYVAVRATALPPDIAGYPVEAPSSTVLLVVGAILAAAVLVLRRTLRTWLRTARDATRAASVRDLLDETSDPASVGPGTLPSARRGAAIIRNGLAVATGAVLAGLALWLLADAPVLARVGIVVVATGAGVCVLVVGLLPSLLRAVERREHLAAPPDPMGRRVPPPGLRAPLAGVAAGVGALSLVILGIASVDAARVVIDGCWPAEGWSCGQVTVAAVPGSTGSRRDTVEVAYAVHPADDPDQDVPRRVLLIAVGGPGSSGIAEADWYAGTLPPEILDTYDIVLFDPRGTGSTDRRGCPSAYREYVREETTGRAKTFAASCITEAGAAGMDMRRFGTAAVGEDIEAIRIALGVEAMAVYGSSYGTVVAQAYAASHPDRVSALVLDAPVDRQLDGIEVWRTAAAGFGDVLRQSFRACSYDDQCVEGLADPPAAWDRLVRRLEADGGLSAVLPDGSGTPVGTDATTLEVMGAVRSALYESTGRATLLRALAAADRGDDRLFVRLVEAGGDQAWWPEAFAYYATWCADVRASPTGRADDADAFERRLAEPPVDAPGGDNVMRTLMPCLYWPWQPALGDEPADPAGVPTLIISATADPITPGSEARGIHRRIDGSHLIEVDGGEHVSFGGGDSCVDDAVSDFLVSGRPPHANVTRCESWVADRYVPLTPYGARPVDVPWSIAVELLNDPLYVYWDGETSLVVPCLAGGVARISADAVDADRVVLDGCSMHEGTPPADGSGTLNWYGATAVLEVVTSAGRLDFRLDSERATASGTWDGQTYSYGD